MQVFICETHHIVVLIATLYPGRYKLSSSKGFYTYKGIDNVG